MKKPLSLLFSLLFVFSVFDLCAALDAETFSMDEFFETNHLLNIAKNHEALVYETTTIFPEGDLVSHEKSEYIFFEGNIWLDGSVEYSDGHRSCFYAYEAEGFPGKLYTVWGDSPEDGIVTFYPSEEYQEVMANDWLMKDDTFVESLISVEAKDGMIILNTKTIAPDLAYDRLNTYDIDPETGLVKHFISDFSDTEGHQYFRSETTVTYDAPFLPEGEAENIIKAGDDHCEVTLVIDPGKETEETLNTSVRKGTGITFYNKNASPIFADEACTKEIYPVDTSGDSVTVYVDSSKTISWE